MSGERREGRRDGGVRDGEDNERRGESKETEQ